MHGWYSAYIAAFWHLHISENFWLKKMSHSPGIVYQTSRSIRSIIVDIFIFLNSKILVKPFLHSPIPRFPFFLLTRKSWLSLHPRHWIQEYLFHKYSIQVRSGIVKTTCMSNKSLYLIEFYFYWRVKIVIILMHFTIDLSLSSGYADPHGANHRPRSIL